VLPNHSTGATFGLIERHQDTRTNLAGVLSLVEQAEQATAGEDKQAFRFLLWKSAAEAEYLAFQLSIGHGLGDFEPGDERAESEAELTLQAARKLLLEAKSSLQSNPREAYRSVRKAVTILRKMHLAAENVSKERRKSRPERNGLEQS
jgi:hypothetical protein